MVRMIWARLIHQRRPKSHDYLSIHLLFPATRGVYTPKEEPRAPQLVLGNLEGDKFCDFSAPEGHYEAKSTVTLGSTSDTKSAKREAKVDGKVGFGSSLLMIYRSFLQ